MLALGDLDGDVVVVLLEQDLQLGLDVLLRELEQSVVRGECEERAPFRHERGDRPDGRCVRHETVLHVEDRQHVLGLVREGRSRGGGAGRRRRRGVVLGRGLSGGGKRNT